MTWLDKTRAVVSGTDSSLGGTHCDGAEHKHFYADVSEIVREMWRGRTLYRACTYAYLRKVVIEGDILDIGARCAKSEYFDYLNTKNVITWTAAGIEAAAGVTYADLTKRLPFQDETFDNVLAFNVLEHCVDWERALAECRRVTKRGGRTLIVVPFMHEIHNDPGDFVRLTPQGLAACAERVGFVNCSIRTLGEGLLTFVAGKIAQHLVPRRARRYVGLATFAVAYPLDRCLRRRAPGGVPLAARFALGVVGEMTR